jgi:hypothetical protein
MNVRGSTTSPRLKRIALVALAAIIGVTLFARRTA